MAVMSVGMIGTSTEGYLFCMDPTHGTLSANSSGLTSAPEVTWCKHIEDFMASGSDSEGIAINSNERPDRALEIIVPYIPSHDIYAELVMEVPQHGNRPVHFSEDQKLEFLGFWTPGEGRMILRSMVHDWFTARIDWNEECKSTEHGYAAQLAWDKSMKSRDVGLKMAQRWSVYFEGRCLSCLGRKVGVDDGNFAEDLVPRDEKATPWNNPKKK